MNIYFWLLVLTGVIEGIVRFEDMVFTKVWEKKREEEEGKKKKTITNIKLGQVRDFSSYF